MNCNDTVTIVRGSVPPMHAIEEWPCERAMVEVVRDSTSLRRGWIYPVVLVDNATFMLDCSAVSIFLTFDDIKKVNMPYQTILSHAQKSDER